jgi:hypothetical protein
MVGRAALLVVCLAPGAALAATPEAALKAAENLYYEGRYADAVTALDAVAARPDASKKLKLAALKTSAFCQFLLGDNRKARETWLKLLALEPGYKLDPVEASPEIAEFFGRLRAKEEKPPEAKAPEVIHATKAPASDAPPAKAVDPMPPPPEIRECGVVLCLLPFGIAQFVNGNPGKGAGLAAAQVIFLGTNIALYWNRVAEFEKYGGFRDRDAAETKFTIQHVSLGLFVATVAVGIVDAYLFP